MTSRQDWTAEEGGERLDIFLARRAQGLSRSRIKRLIQDGHALVNSELAQPGQRLKPGDLVSLSVPPPTAVALAAEPIPLRIVYQDAHLLVVDKPAGLTVHPAPGHPSGTLVNALLALCSDLSGIGGELRPGIVHRLDKDTSGLMVVAKSDASHRELSRQWKERSVRKGYLALVSGRLAPAEGVVDAPVGRDPRNRKRMAIVPDGRVARTRYRTLRPVGVDTLVELLPETGRTHQIRVHMAALGHPLVGDALYGRRDPRLSRQFLHAHLLAFNHPATGQRMEFTSPLPEELARLLS
ncbi:MAG: RluA family pseudouridine synthase [Chloroflexota bacterium]|nr:RluA family pseudouridine synthase [Chloroflexota bacterium]